MHQDFEIALTDDVKVRQPPKPELDAKGRPKPFKPDPKEDPDYKLGGIKGTPGDLRAEGWAGVVLGRTREGKIVGTLVYWFGDMPGQQ